MVGRKIISESNSIEVYVLCMNSAAETQIFGIFTDKRLLLDSYNVLLTEDYSQKPIIYKMPLNGFIARKQQGYSEETFIFYAQLEDYEVGIDQICRRIKVAEFYGFEVYCDLNFTDGPFYSVDYHGGDEPGCGKIDIEHGMICGNIGKYELRVLEEWYEDNKEILWEMWKSKKLVDIPEWGDVT